MRGQIPFSSSDQLEQQRKEERECHDLNLECGVGKRRNHDALSIRIRRHCRFESVCHASFLGPDCLRADRDPPPLLSLSRMGSIESTLKGGVAPPPPRPHSGDAVTLQIVLKS